jgi:peptide/nickel transport system substrate-binding protein
MYQVYHIDSTATSTLNWGYKQIKANVGNKYATEFTLVNDLSDIIEEARKTNDQNRRKVLYDNALDIVMQLAVELPTYQRDDLFAYNAGKIDVSTFTSNNDLSPYKGLTSDLHTISLKIS